MGSLSGFVEGKKSDICAYTDSVPKFGAFRIQLMGSLILVLFFSVYLTHFLMDVSSSLVL